MYRLVLCAEAHRMPRQSYRVEQKAEGEEPLASSGQYPVSNFAVGPCAASCLAYIGTDSPADICRLEEYVQSRSDLAGDFCRPGSGV